MVIFFGNTPRNIFDVAFGTENPLRSGDHNHRSVQLMVTDFANKVGLYNFLSTSNGTHFLPPRTYH